jgi:hypothetical protein
MIERMPIKIIDSGMMKGNTCLTHCRWEKVVLLIVFVNHGTDLNEKICIGSFYMIVQPR